MEALIFLIVGLLFNITGYSIFVFQCPMGEASSSLVKNIVFVSYVSSFNIGSAFGLHEHNRGIKKARIRNVIFTSCIFFVFGEALVAIKCPKFWAFDDCW